MSSLSTIPKGDSAWLLRKAVQRIMQQVSVLETNIGSSTTGNSANTQVIFNDAGTLRGDAGLTYNAATDTLSAGSATITGDLTVDTNTFYVKSSTNQVGIGTTSPDPNFAFDITASSDARGRQWFANTAFVGTGDLSTGFQIRTLGTGTNGLKIANSGNTTEWMRIDSSGNVGIGVASPSFKLSAAGVSQFYAESDGIYASGNSSPDLYVLGVNYYNNAGTEGVKNSTRPSWKIEHKNSSDAVAYFDIGYRAGSAGASVFTSRFKIDGSGNVILQPSSTPPTLGTNGQLTVNATSDTNLRFSYRGSDGVTRVANLTLA